MEGKLKIPYPVIVEGKYDKNTLSSVLDARIITLGGFSVFNNKEMRALIQRLAEKDKIILLTDSDGGGIQIRSFIESCVSRESIINLYIPRIHGKERRKKKSGKAGLLGVEGMPPDVIRRIFLPVSKQSEEKLSDISCARISKTQFYNDGFSGRENSANMRKLLSDILSLPSDISANALLEAVNLICTPEEYENAKKQLTKIEKKGKE